MVQGTLLECVLQDLSHHDDDLFEWQFRLIKKVSKDFSLEMLYEKKKVDQF